MKFIYGLPTSLRSTSCFFYYYYFQVFLTDPRSPIPDPRFSIPDPRSSILAPGFPEKLDMGFLFYGHEVLKVECVIVKYKATRINTAVTHTQRQTRS